jgi:hypothetical protein
MDEDRVWLAITRTYCYRVESRSHEQKVNGSSHQELPANELVLGRSCGGLVRVPVGYPATQTHQPTARTKKACKLRPFGNRSVLALRRVRGGVAAAVGGEQFGQVVEQRALLLAAGGCGGEGALSEPFAGV